MFKSLVVIGALAVAAPSLALAQGNLNNTPASQNANGLSSVSQKKDSPVAVAKSTLRPRRTEAAGSGLGQLGQRGVISSLI
jgi:hypothetical protein